MAKVTALQKINARVKQLAKKHPGKKRVTLQRQAGAEYRNGKLGKVKKKIHPTRKLYKTKKRRTVGSTTRRTTNIGKDTVDRKRVSINVGSITASHAKSVIRADTKSKLAASLLARDLATTKVHKRKINKRIISLRSELKKFSS